MPPLLLLLLEKWQSFKINSFTVFFFFVFSSPLVAPPVDAKTEKAKSKKQKAKSTTLPEMQYVYSTERQLKTPSTMSECRG